MRKFLKVIFSFYLLSIAINGFATEGNTAKYAPTLSEKALLAKNSALGIPSLTVGSYDLRQGLLAMYESPEGKRILFRSSINSNKKITTYAYHFNEKSKKIETLIEPSFNPINPKEKTVKILGIDLLDLLSKGQKNKRFDTKQQIKLKNFLRSEEGVALIDGVGAMYLQLDTAGQDKTLALLKAPFGGIRMALELVTGQYNGLDHVESLVGTEKTSILSQACPNGKCVYRHAQFTIQRSGFFDVLSSNPTSSPKTAQKSNCPPVNTTKLSNPIFLGTPTEENPDCHGMCGPGCFNPGEISTRECQGHDDCIRQTDSHLSCMFSVPEDCIGCNSLVDAAWSWLKAIFS